MFQIARHLDKSKIGLRLIVFGVFILVIVKLLHILLPHIVSSTHIYSTPTWKRFRIAQCEFEPHREDLMLQMCTYLSWIHSQILSIHLGLLFLSCILFGRVRTIIFILLCMCILLLPVYGNHSSNLDEFNVNRTNHNSVNRTNEVMKQQQQQIEQNSKEVSQSKFERIFKEFFFPEDTTGNVIEANSQNSYKNNENIQQNTVSEIYSILTTTNTNLYLLHSLVDHLSRSIIKYNSPTFTIIYIGMCYLIMIETCRNWPNLFVLSNATLIGSVLILSCSCGGLPLNVWLPVLMITIIYKTENRLGSGPIDWVKRICGS
jgi:hypothetical protein